MKKMLILKSNGTFDKNQKNVENPERQKQYAEKKTGHLTNSEERQYSKKTKHLKDLENVKNPEKK